MRRVAIAGILVTLVTASSCARSRRPPGALPDVVVWAWERPEDLRALDSRIGVAFLAQTITLDEGHARVASRRQPLRVSPAASLVAVTRIEVAASAAVAAIGIDAIAAPIAASAALPRVAGVQIDFDATASERSFYRDLLGAVRERLPHTPISITALASWCAGDRWLEGLPIDEAVPMLFRMGPANEPFRRIASTPSGVAPVCRGAVGVSLDEPIAVAADGRRVYVFDPRAWSELALRRVARGVPD